MIEFNATFLVAMLSFVVFILIMNAIFYRPVLNIIRKRDEYIASNYEESKNSLETAKTLENERNGQIDATRTKCRKEFNDAVEKFRAEASGQLKAAKDKNKAVLAERKNKLQEEETGLSNELQNSVVGNLAQAITSKILGSGKVKVNQ